MMTAFTEHLISIVRTGPHARTYGDDWTHAVVVRWHSPTKTEVSALNSEDGFIAGHFRAIERELVKLGLEEVFWTRRDGGVEIREIKRRKRDVSRTQPAAGAQHEGDAARQEPDVLPALG